mmetsp:Transcript_10971/g.15254  ORF Transcript_10971/g.15254 Transcript_10971/m.15254 type:complete len:220 (-) Transcript_10971:382-1041(-)
MGMRNGEVAKDISCTDTVCDQSANDCVPEAEISGKVAKDESPTNTHAGKLIVVFCAEGMARVEIHLPEQSDKRADNVREESSLHTNPSLALGSFFLVSCSVDVEEDKGKCVQVNVMLKLLRHSVVLVVLVAPPSRGHSTANTVGDDLKGVVDLDVSGERVMASLMHEPSATALNDAENYKTGDSPTSEEEVQTEKVHTNNLGETESHVRVVGFEKTLFL